jgi:uncharacterized protein YdaU (DUF1376 family)
MSKSLWFPFYTADFLSSPDVQDMEAHEVGAYVLLLARSWQSDSPGYLENDEQAIRRAARLNVAQWAESRTIVLKKWPLVEGNDTLRHNRRLVHEAETAVELREKKAEAGRKSAERRAQIATQRQQTGNTNPTPVEIPATGVGQNANQLQLQPQLQSTKVDEEREASAPKEEVIVQPLKAQTPERRLPPPPDNAELFTADNWMGLNNPATFASICTDLRLPIDLDRETYRATIQDKMRGLSMNAPATTLRSWIASFFVNEKKKGPLLTLTQGLPTKPTPKHELPKPGQEQRGQVLAFEGENDDYINRTRQKTYQQHWPAATIHIITPR